MKRIQAIIDEAATTLAQAQRDVARYTDLVARNATPIVTLNNAQTLVNVSRATAESNRAQLENLKIQLGYCTIRAPISGRIPALCRAGTARPRRPGPVRGPNYRDPRGWLREARWPDARGTGLAATGRGRMARDPDPSGAGLPYSHFDAGRRRAGDRPDRDRACGARRAGGDRTDPLALGRSPTEHPGPQTVRT